MKSTPSTGLSRIESLSPQRLQREVERPRLARQLRYAAARSPFYRRKFKAFGADGAAWLRRFGELPFTDKRELLGDQVDHPPFGANLCAHPTELRRVHKTSGTTARPLLVPMTASDIAATVACGARSFGAAGLKAGLTVAHCLNYCMWMGGYTDHQSLEATGATVLPYGVGNTRALLELMLRLRVDAIHCTPSYLAILEESLRAEFRLEPKDLDLKLGLFGGEPGIEDQGFRGAVESRWGLRAMNANYGMADVLSIFGGECRVRDGLHFMGQGAVLVELLDPSGLRPLPAEEGVEGELVLTNLDRQAQPVVRYRTGDIVRIVARGPCRCGRRSFRFLVKGRTDDMLVVRGVNVFPCAVRTAVTRFKGRLSGQFQIVLETPPPLQSFVVRAECQRPMAKPARSRLAARLLGCLRHGLGVSPTVDLVPPGSLPRTEGKAGIIVRR